MLDFDILLTVGDPAQVFGQVQAPSQALIWDLPKTLNALNSRFSGFALDATGEYLTQAERNVWIDADETQWTASSGSYGRGTADRRQDNKKFLRQTNGTGAFSTVHGYARAADEGFVARLWVGDNPSSSSAPTLYLEFNHGHAGGAVGYRLAIEAGKPLRLQTDTGPAGAWTDAAASVLGDAEAYLSSAGRWLEVSVQPQTDPSWYSGWPTTAVHSQRPPDRLVVSINNGDDKLVVPCGTLAAGSLAVTGQDRQWACAYAKKRYLLNPSGRTTTQASARVFATTPVARLRGYVPASTTATASVTLADVNKAYVDFSLAAADDGTGYSVRTVFLSRVAADFPAAQVARAVSPDFVTYRACFCEVTKEFDPTTRMERRKAEVWFNNNDGSMSPNATSGPGGVHLAARAARLSLSRDGGDTYWFQLTGWTGLDKDSGLRWEWFNGQSYFVVTVWDRFRKGDPDQRPVVGALPYGGTPAKWAMRDFYNRLGVTDDWLMFDLLDRDGDYAAEYYLPPGTAGEPAYDFDARTNITPAMVQVNADCAEYDPDSGQALPTLLRQDSLGNCYFYGLPVGVVAYILDPLAPWPGDDVPAHHAYSETPGFDGDGSPLYNELLDGESSTTADLTVVRAPVIYEGVDTQTGDIILGWAYNEAVGGGPSADPFAPGNVGTDVEMVIISSKVSSAAYALTLADIAAVQARFPSIGTRRRLHLQPDLAPLDVITVQEEKTQGTTDPVAYWVVGLTHTVDLRGQTHVGETTVTARLLGQA